jgi:hypothetical protein
MNLFASVAQWKSSDFVSRRFRVQVAALACSGVDPRSEEECADRPRATSIDPVDRSTVRSSDDAWREMPADSSRPRVEMAARRVVRLESNDSRTDGEMVAARQDDVRLMSNGDQVRGSAEVAREFVSRHSCEPQRDP